MMQNEVKTQIQYQEIGEAISHDLALKMIKDYHDANPSESDFFYTGKEIMMKLLNQPGCVGMRIYNALEQNGKPTLVYVGIDVKGEPILEYTAVNNDGRLERLKAMAVDKNGTGTETSTSLSWFSSGK